MNETTTKFVNILLLGFTFMLLFTGFNTMASTQTLVYEYASNVSDFNVNGFVTSGIIYVLFAFNSWLSPSFVVVFGPRMSMLAAAMVYVFYVSQYLYLNTYSVYVATCLVGLAAPVIWTAQGFLLANNSDPETITRNSGIFWAMNMSSGFIGNLIAFLLFNGKEDIDKDTRMTLGAILTSVSFAGSLVIFLFRPMPWAEKSDSNFLQTLKDSWSLFITPKMLMFCVTMAFTGFNQSLWAGVYSTCIGFTEGFGENRTALASISAILIAAGEVVGGLLFGLLGFLTVKWGRHPIILLGFVLCLLSYGLMLANFPQNAPFEETQDIGFIEPNKALALTTSFLLGLGDSCFNTQVASMLGSIWKDQAASAFGIFKFVQSIITGIAFLYTPVLGFYWQLLIATIFAVAGTVTSVMIELKSRREIVN